jgi:hypothetical protein
MKNFVIIATLIFSIPAVAQTKVIKKNAVKSNDYGITYVLPKTLLQVDANVAKTVYTVGPYYRYAEKYLGVDNAIVTNHTTYALTSVAVDNIGVPDQDNTFIVSFKPGTVAPYAYLTEDGLLCAINADYEASAKKQKKAASSKSPDINEASIYSEELLMAGSTSKQAEVAARQIYRIRESRMNILTGESENTPPDGVAMKLVIQQLEEQENALMALFIGTTKQTNETKTFDITPAEDIEKEVLFRFSTQRGIVDADDLGGAPAYLTLTAIEKAPLLDPKEAEKKAKKMKGIVYNVPGKVRVTIDLNAKKLFNGDFLVTQLGTQEALAPVLFEDKKAPVKVFFYPETGAIKQIIQ